MLLACIIIPLFPNTHSLFFFGWVLGTNSHALFRQYNLVLGRLENGGSSENGLSMQFCQYITYTRQTNVQHMKNEAIRAK
ncbi:hypothetical protein C8R43DRAFT_217975 [Mycena crocata]|nr:hypothetical protein C8R43DRAFT_217975 [Mycena crocata]